MPQVPEYDSLSVGLNQMPNAQVRSFDGPVVAGKDLASLGQGLMEGSAAINRIAVRQMELDNQAAVDKAETGLRTFLVDYEKSAQQMRGDDASGLSEKFAGDYRKFSSEMAKGLANDVQRQLFAKKSDELGLHSLAKLSHYEATQKQEARLQNNEALGKYLVSASAMAAFSYDAVNKTFKDGPEFEQARGQLFENIEHRAEIMGLGKDSPWTQEMKAEALSRIYAERVTSLMNTDPGNALGYFQSVRGDIRDANVRNHLDGAVTRLDRQTRVESEVEQKWQDTAPADRAALGVWVTQKYSGEDQKAALQIFNELRVTSSEATDATRKSMANVAWQAVFAKPSLKAVRNDVKVWLQANDHSTWREIETYVKSKQEGAGEAARKTDPNTYYELTKMQAADPQGFAGLDLRTYINRLSQADFEKFANAQRDAEKPHKVAEAATLQQQLAGAHNRMGFGSKDQEKKGAFDKAVQDAIDAEQSARGKALDYKERDGIINRMMLEGKVHRDYIWDASKRFFEVQGTPEAEKWRPTKATKAAALSDVPAADQGLIRDSIRKAGRVPTPQMIIDAYNRKNGL